MCRIQILKYIFVSAWFYLVAVFAAAGDEPKPGPDFKWNINAPATIAATSGRSIPIEIVVGANEAIGVSLAAQSFFEKVTGAQLPDFKLCLKETCPSNPNSINLSANTPTTVYLVPPEEHRWWQFRSHGDFNGKVVIKAAEKKEGDEIGLELALTSWCAWFLGMGLLAFGVILSSYFTPPDPAPNTRGKFDKLLMLLGFKTPDAITTLTDYTNLPLEGKVKNQADLPQMEKYSTQANRDLRRGQAQLLLIVASIVLGVNTVVLTSSFGTWKDFLASLLWGLGSPLGSRAITSLAALVIP